MESSKILSFISIIGTFFNIIFTFVSSYRNIKIDNKQTAKNEGILISDIGYIKSSIDRIEKTFNKLEEKYNNLEIRLNKVEQKIDDDIKRKHT